MLGSALYLLAPARGLSELVGYQARSLARAPSAEQLDLQLKRVASGAQAPIVPLFGTLLAPGLAVAPTRLPKVAVLARLESAASAAELSAAGYPPRAQVGRVAALALSPNELSSVAKVPGVLRLQPQLQHRLHLDVNTARNHAVEARVNSGVTGAGVLIGVIDTGIDWRHGDFRHADGSTRIRAVWDQVDDSFANSGGAVGSLPPVDDGAGAPLGTVYTAAQINAALAGAGTVNSRDLVGHGTHAAGCAASNGLAPGGYIGVAPAAEILMVRAGGEAAEDFNLVGDVLAGLQWLGEQADQSGQPLVVSMSFGHHFGAHDGTDAEEVAIDDFTSRSGRAVAVSAGNERAAAIHTSGSALGSRALQLAVTSESNDFLAVDCWLAGDDVVDLGFFDPDGLGFSDADVTPGECVQVENRTNRVSTCVDTVNPLNGSREVLFLAEPRDHGGTITTGTWQIVLRDEGGVSDGRYHCWSVNYQPFTADVDSTATVAMPATARGALAVGAASLRASWPSAGNPNTQIDSPVIDDIAFFSSSGPTRDGRFKPDLVTGGNWVLSAWSEGDGSGSAMAGIPRDERRVSADGTHVASRGTSFSAPQVAGAVALMLEANSQLAAGEIGDRLRTSASSDAFTGTVPNPLWGYGKLDVAAAVAKAALACVADCDGDGEVTVNELVTGVLIALGDAGIAACPRADRDDDGLVTIDELTAGVLAALHGCRA
ncbi:MAG: S8 family serine peptidase [Deltaproteobacteria bacterium]|nr:S8 family serine peptidase [Deltaproteobacteria bacterium]